MPDYMDPRSRKEVFLKGVLDGDPPDLDPNDRIELYLKQIAEGGGKKYLHSLKIELNSGPDVLGCVTATLINKSSDPITMFNLEAALTDAGITDTNQLYVSGHAYYAPNTNTHREIYGMYPYASTVYFSWNIIQIYFGDTVEGVSGYGSGSINIQAVRDTIIEI